MGHNTTTTHTLTSIAPSVNRPWRSRRGAPTRSSSTSFHGPSWQVDVKILGSEKGVKRILEVSFNALSPGQNEVPRRALVAAIQPEGAADLVMFVGGSTAGQWKKVEPSIRKMASSFTISRVRPTSIKRKSKNDYRFEDQGGLNERGSDSVNNIF